jgi:hypothetical protein
MINISAIRHGRHAWKYFFVLFTFSSIFFFSFYSNDSLSKGISASVTPTTTLTPNALNDSFSIKLDRTTVGGTCPTGYRCSGNCNNNPLVVSVVSNTKSENNSLRYNYIAPYGRIAGEGAKVSWDLKGAQPGTYEIKIDIIDDKSGNLLQSATKTITVEECNDDGDRCLAACPALFVDAPTTPTHAGKTIIFTANFSGGTGEKMIYNWKVTGGKIIEGQGTPTIKVTTNRKMAGKVVKATANFKWDNYCWEICNKTASASNLVATKKRKGK